MIHCKYKQINYILDNDVYAVKNDDNKYALYSILQDDTITDFIFDDIGTLPCRAQEIQPEYAPVIKDNKLGYIDRSGKIMIPIEHDIYPDYIQDGIVSLPHWTTFVNFYYDEDVGHPYLSKLGIAVCKDGKFGYCNEFGELIIPYKFDKAYGFYDNGRASVVYNNERRFINLRGEFVN